MYLLFDIGGTKMRLAKSEDHKKVSSIEIVKTPQNFQEGVDLFARIADKLADGKKITVAAGGMAGPLDNQKSKLLNAPHLPGWIEKPLKKTLAKNIGSNVYLENDAALSGLGEATYGSGQGYKIVVYITISTGVGGARIVNSHIDTNALGFEPGHQIIEKDGVLCPTCNMPGHLEGYVSGTAIKKRFGKNPEEIKDPKVWDDIAELLAIGLNNTIVHWSPDIVILGGSVMKSLSTENIKGHLKNILTIFKEAPILKKTALGDTGGLYGAMALLNQKNYDQNRSDY